MSDLNDLRNAFVQRLSASGATRLYFGDVIAIFDMTLAEYCEFLEVKPGAPCVPETTLDGLLQTDPNHTGLDFAGAEKALADLKAEQKTQGMELDDSEPQPNADVIARVTEHAQAVKAGKITPPEKADVTKVPKGALKGGK